MVLKLYRGETCLRTIYNVIKVTQNELGTLHVKNKQDRVLVTNTWRFNKDYHRYIIDVD